MILFKNHKSSDGFSLIEVALSLVMLGMVLSALLMLQHTVVEGVYGFSNRLQAVLVVKKRLAEAAFNRMYKGLYTDIKEKKQQTVEKLTVTYEQKKPAKGSALEKINALKIEKVTADWKEWDGPYFESLITFLYMPEQKKS